VLSQPSSPGPAGHGISHTCQPQTPPRPLHIESFVLAPGHVQGPEVSAQFIPTFRRARVCHFIPTFADTLSGEPIMSWDRRAEPQVAYGKGVQAADGLR
jgi:hypothetical protein